MVGFDGINPFWCFHKVNQRDFETHYGNQILHANPVYEIIWAYYYSTLYIKNNVICNNIINCLQITAVCEVPSPAATAIFLHIYSLIRSGTINGFVTIKDYLMSNGWVISNKLGSTTKGTVVTWMRSNVKISKEDSGKPRKLTSQDTLSAIRGRLPRKTSFGGLRLHQYV